jgi:hypothetical protein
MQPTILPPRHHLLPCGDLIITDPYGGRQVDAADWMWLGNAIILLDSRAREWAAGWERAYALEPELDALVGWV